MKKLLILGAGQHGMVVKEIAEATGKYDTIAFLDDNSPQAIGKLNEYEKFKDNYTDAVVAIGDAVLRINFIDKLEKSGFEIPVLIHPKAYVSPSATIEKGSFIEPLAIIHTDVNIGAGCIISAGTIVNHNSTVGFACHLNCGTIVASGSVIKSQMKTEYGTRII